MLLCVGCKSYMDHDICRANVFLLFNNVRFLSFYTILFSGLNFESCNAGYLSNNKVLCVLSELK